MRPAVPAIFPAAGVRKRDAFLLVDHPFVEIHLIDRFRAAQLAADLFFREAPGFALLEVRFVIGQDLLQLRLADAAEIVAEQIHEFSLIHSYFLPPEAACPPLS